MPHRIVTLVSSSDPDVERLRAAQGPFVVAVEKTAMPMIFTDADPNSPTIIFANASFLGLVGRALHDVIGRSLEDIIASEPEHRGAHRSIRNALASGTEQEWKLRCQKPDGTAFWSSVFATPVLGPGGHHMYNFLSFATLGENGEPFVERRDELAALYDQSPGFIAIAEGPNHTFTFANAAYKKFVNKQNLIGQTVLEAMPGLVQQGILDILDQVYQTGIAYVGSDVEMLFDDGRSESPVKRYCDFVYQPIRAEDGSIKGLFCEGYDVTEKHLAAESMSQLQSQVIHLSRSNAMGTMAATLAHELQQPITAIGNYSVAGRRHLARSDKDAIDQASSALEAIKELAERTGLLIKNLRDLTAQRQSQWVEFNLHDAIVECISLVEAAIGQPVAIVAKSVESLLVNADRIQIQQVLINLLKNACECSENARELNVEISATLNRDQIRVCVKDTGTGISAEVANSLFCLGRSRKADGMGIGLSVSRTIIESHGGKIWLESTSSAGSLFCFEIPASQSQIGGNV